MRELNLLEISRNDKLEEEQENNVQDISRFQAGHAEFPYHAPKNEKQGENEEIILELKLKRETSRVDN
jgi:hypothetical protein